MYVFGTYMHVFACIVCYAVPDCVYRGQGLLPTPTTTCAVSLAVGSCLA